LHRAPSLCVPTCCVVAALALALLPVSGFAQAWSESFEGGSGSAAPYHKDGPTTRFEIVTNDAADGGAYLRATPPDLRRLAGFSVTATGLQGGRLATVTAKVRGNGQAWLCLNSRNGWLYSPDTVALTDTWQSVSLSKALMMADVSLGIFFISREEQQGAVFEVDDIRVSLAAPVQTYDADVAPLRLEAEEFAASREYVQADATASGGEVASQTQYLRLVGLPVARTSRPISVYLRVKTGDIAEEWRLGTTQGGNSQAVVKVKPTVSGQWTWLRLHSAHAVELGESCYLECWREKGARDAASVDSLVVGTAADLSDEQLDAVGPWLPGRPLVAVSRCRQAPAIDGKPEDACWAQTLACGGFLNVGSTVLAEAQTTARLCYDDQNLYVLFSCDEPILSVAGQRRHEFVAQAKEPDAEVSRDDSCLLILAPDGSGQEAFDLFANALGTVEDARCQAPDLWEKRDKAWNSGAQAAGSLEDGRWHCEMTIPLAALGGVPQPGDMWRAVIGRIARARSETSAWNLCNKGFHDPREMGTLVFGPLTLAGEMRAPAALQPGRNSLSATLSSGEGAGALLVAELAEPRGPRHEYAYAAVGTEATEAQLGFQMADAQELQVGYGLHDAATLRPLCLTPVVPRAVRSTFADVTVTCDGPYELRVNGAVVGRGASAQDEVLRAPLGKGSNALTLKLDKGTAAVSVKAPGLDSQAARWRMAPAGGADPSDPATDDVTWPEAPVDTGADGRQVLGTPGEPAVLRQTLLWEKTRAWPTPEPALYIARGQSQHLTFIADGLPGRRLDGFTIYLAVPPEFEILGSTGYYGHNDYQPSFDCTQLGEKEIDGRKLRVAKVVASKPIVTGRHPIMSVVNVLVKLRDGAEVTGDETRFSYWTEANGGSVTEARQEFKVRLLPALRGVQPKELVWQLWASFFSAMDDKDMRAEILDTARAAGVTDIVAGDRWTTEAAKARGMTHTMGVNFQTWSLNMKPYLEAHPDHRLIDAKGKPNDTLVCTSRLLGDAWSAAVEPVLGSKLREAGADTADYDYEYSPFTGPHSCYCPQCLEQFRKAAGLAADAPLDAAHIQDELGDQWVDFMAHRTAEVLLRMKESVHRLAPGTQFSVYSGYQSPENPRQYGINWGYIGDLQACDRAGCGYGRPVADIPATIAALKGIPVLFGSLLYPYDTAETTPQSPLTRAELLRRSLDATGGVLLYERQTMDGRTWQAIAETTRLVAAHEDLFLRGERKAIEGQDPAAVQMLDGGEVALVLVMNHASKPTTYRVTLPAELGAGEEFYTGLAVTAGEEVEVQLEAGGTAAYVLRR